MASKSPGAGGGKPPTEPPPHPRPRSRGRPALTDKVGFFEQVWRTRHRSRSTGKDTQTVGTASETEREVTRYRTSRIEVGYYGPRTDARDRSSEDPRRHRIPRIASLSPGRGVGEVVDTPNMDESDMEENSDMADKRRKMRRRSASKERELERRASRERSLERGWRRDRSRSVEPPPGPVQSVDYEAEFEKLVESEMGKDKKRFILAQRSESQRSAKSQSETVETSDHKRFDMSTCVVHPMPDLKPRSLSFRVSPAKHIATVEHFPSQTDSSLVTTTTNVSNKERNKSSSHEEVHFQMQKSIQMHKEFSESSVIQHTATSVLHPSIQKKIIDAGAAQQKSPAVSFAQSMIDDSEPPPLPQRPPRQQRYSEPAMFPSMPKVELMAFEVQKSHPQWQEASPQVSHQAHLFQLASQGL